MGRKTDQDHARRVGDRLAPPTTPDRATIREDREESDAAHVADRPPTPAEEEAAGRSDDLTPNVEKAYKQAIELGAAQEGEGKPGL